MMKALVGLGLIAFSLFIPTASNAMFEYEQVSEVPIERLLTNLQFAEGQCTDDRCKADVEYRIARLNAMQYARRTHKVEVDARLVNSKTLLEPKLGGYERTRWPNYRQYEVTKAPLDKQAQQALTEAIAHYIQSVRFEPKNAKALLGLGWSLKEHGDIEKARDVLRKAFKSAHNKVAAAVDQETFPSSSYEDRLAQEIALYLIPLLDSKKDAKEIESLSAVGKPDYEPRWVTPIVVPTKPNIASDGLMQRARVTFDIDGFGKQRLKAWPSKSAGWLVWDPLGKGQIKSGIQLIGSSTFWVFWDNGYDVLSALDDNHDGQLSEKELDGLALWVDENCNGISESGEVKPLSWYKIKGLSCKFSNFGKFISNQHGVTFSSGKTAPTYDWIFKTNAKSNQDLAKDERRQTVFWNLTVNICGSE